MDKLELTDGERKLLSFVCGCYIDDFEHKMKRQKAWSDTAKAQHAKIERLIVRLNPESQCGDITLATGETLVKEK